MDSPRAGILCPMPIRSWARQWRVSGPHFGRLLLLDDAGPLAPAGGPTERA